MDRTVEGHGFVFTTSRIVFYRVVLMSAWKANPRWHTFGHQDVLLQA